MLDFNVHSSFHVAYFNKINKYINPEPEFFSCNQPELKNWSLHSPRIFHDVYHKITQELANLAFVKNANSTQELNTIFERALNISTVGNIKKTKYFLDLILKNCIISPLSVKPISKQKILGHKYHKIPIFINPSLFDFDQISLTV